MYAGSLLLLLMNRPPRSLQLLDSEFYILTVTGLRRGCDHAKQVAFSEGYAHDLRYLKPKCFGRRDVAWLRQLTQASISMRR
jgi:hypothetical protein